MLLRLLELEAKSANQVVVISLMDRGPVGKKIQALGIEVIPMNMFSVKAIFFVLIKLRSFLKDYKPDVVQTWLYHADMLGGIAARLAGIDKVFWGIHCSNVPLGNKTTKWVMKINSLLSRFIPEKIVAVAEMSKINHIKHGYMASKFSVIQNGFTVGQNDVSSDQSEFRQKFNVSGSSFLIGVVGRYHPDKGQDVLLSALAQLRNDDRWCCMMVGRGCDQQNAELVALISSFGLEDRIRLVGEQDNVVRFMDNFDVFCLPSRSEAFPMALGEAMTRRCCCIATDVGDCRTLLFDAGLIVPPGDAEKLASALVQSMEMTPEQREALGSIALDRIDRFFSIQRTRDKYLALYAESRGD